MRIPTEVKVELGKEAKKQGMSFTAFLSLLMERAILQKQIEETVKKELDTLFAPYMFHFAKIASKNRQTKRILTRLRDNPSEDIDTIAKQIEEEVVN